MGDASGILLVLQTPKAGRADDHRDWYLSTHLPDVCAIPGVIDGVFAGVDGSGPASQWSNVAIYWLTCEPGGFLQELFGRVGAGKMMVSDTLDPEQTMMTIGEALTPRRCSTLTPDSPAGDRQYYVMLTNPIAGHDDQFNAWYSDVHLNDVLDVPGFVAAQRFRLADNPALQPCPYRYLAIYEIQGGAAEAALAELNARAGTGQMVVSPTLDTTAVLAALFNVEGACRGSG